MTELLANPYLIYERSRYRPTLLASATSTTACSPTTGSARHIRCPRRRRRRRGGPAARPRPDRQCPRGRRRGRGHAAVAGAGHPGDPRSAAAAGLPDQPGHHGGMRRGAPAGGGDDEDGGRSACLPARPAGDARRASPGRSTGGGGAAHAEGHRRLAAGHRRGPQAARRPADDDGEEELARQEKAAALEMLATSRLSVLIGAAGTGKTTLLRALAASRRSPAAVCCCSPRPARRGSGCRTSSARRRRDRSDAGPAPGQERRYDPDTGRYQRSDRNRVSSARTVIVDECSMLTEEALDALLDGIEGFDRLILVGDPRQLPPIGAGRPFVDIVQHLRAQCGPLGFPRGRPSATPN